MTIQSDVNQLESDLLHLQFLKERKKNLEALIEDVTLRLKDALTESVSFQNSDGDTFYAVTVTPVTKDIDLDRLRELDEDLYFDATKRVLDRDKFAHLIQVDRITNDQVMEVLRTRTSKSYIKITDKPQEATSD